MVAPWSNVVGTSSVSDLVAENKAKVDASPAEVSVTTRAIFVAFCP